eukprot:4941486-Ditylum_brightwellii.AAC.1
MGYDLLLMIMDRNQTRACGCSSLLTEHADFSINTVNSPTSKAMGVILGICASHHGTDLQDLHSINMSLYHSVNKLFPPLAQCKSYTQFAK